ncbi:MAG: hypothetical protein LBT91_00730 [Bifidobacteriaceae bacterium]|jgi:hypothetical protein|nr:hypothetical protein [Bifidobacteriaceae bacterium]
MKKHIILSFLTISFFGVSIFVNSQLIYANTPTSVLPISRGGTGENLLSNVKSVGSAYKLENSGTINGLTFDGAKDINISFWKTFKLEPGDNYIQTDVQYVNGSGNLKPAITFNARISKTDSMYVKYFTKVGAELGDYSTGYKTQSMPLSEIMLNSTFESGWRLYFKITNADENAVIHYYIGNNSISLKFCDAATIEKLIAHNKYRNFSNIISI